MLKHKFACLINLTFYVLLACKISKHYFLVKINSIPFTKCKSECLGTNISSITEELVSHNFVYCASFELINVAINSLQKMADVFDVIVVGGGIVGCAVVWEMTSHGYKCLLLEKNEDLVSEASSGNR